MYIDGCRVCYTAELIKKGLLFAIVLLPILGIHHHHFKQDIYLFAMWPKNNQTYSIHNYR